jgi:hypothetical protein
MPGLTDWHYPDLDWREVSESERSAVFAAFNAISGLGGYVDAFEHALALFEFSEAEHRRVSDSMIGLRGKVPDEDLHRVRRSRFEEAKKFFAWMFIAQRDGALTVANLMHSLNTATEAIEGCPALKAVTAMPTILEAKRLFHAYFPQANDVRHGVAHSAEFIGDRDKHAVGGKFYSGWLAGRRYRATVNGVLVEYELTSQSLAQMAEVVNRYYSAFPRRKWPVPFPK